MIINKEMVSMLDLRDFIETLCITTGVHISIVDTSGILNCQHFELPKKYIMHATPFCDFAKDTEGGYALCINEKADSNQIALSGETAFRVCPFGIFRIVKPIIIDSKTICILHISNIILDSRKFNDNISGIAHTNTEAQKFLKLAKHIPAGTDKEYYTNLADIISCHIELLYNTYGRTEITGKYHWLSEALIMHINENYEKNVSLSSFANNYKINVKYMGKLFHKDTGYHFSEYLNMIRLKQSTVLLLDNRTVTDVALSVGFNSVSYFNKMFKEHYGITPSQYSKKYTVNQKQ